MDALTPTRPQASVLFHLLTGGAYRLEPGSCVVAYNGQSLNPGTVDEVVHNGWAVYDDDVLPSMQRLLNLTDAGRDALTFTV
jgi:hypothetical protein